MRDSSVSGQTSPRGGRTAPCKVTPDGRDPSAPGSQDGKRQHRVRVGREDLDGSDEGIFYRLYDASEPCAPAPVPACDTAGKSKLLIKNKSSDDRDKLLWKFRKGATAVDQLLDLADPTTSSIYTLCLYDMSGFKTGLVIPPDAINWSPVGSKGYKYLELSGAASGITKAIIKGGLAGKPKAIVKGKGLALPDVLPLTLPITVHADQHRHRQCFGDTLPTGTSDGEKVDGRRTTDGFDAAPSMAGAALSICAGDGDRHVLRSLVVLRRQTVQRSSTSATLRSSRRRRRASA